MDVVATAGHVDHGKSTLVRALTGMEPDRWAEERRRGLTIDLGFAWTTLDGGRTVAMVDVPGHERFVGNMLAGVGSVPAALVVVAADDGWSAQTAEHVAVLDALGVRHALLAVTKADVADPGPVLADAVARLAATSMGRVRGLPVAAPTGRGVPELAAALEELLAGLPAPDRSAPVRIWLDRAFTIRGAGTVVTGTLAAGSVAVGDRLVLGGREVTVRGMHALGEPVERAGATARVALALRGVAVEQVARGDALLTPGAFRATSELDVVLTSGDAGTLPAEPVLHVGSATVATRLRPLDAGAARLRLAAPLPLRVGDRVLLRDPGTRTVLGADVRDVDPPELRRRGSARLRGAELAGRAPGGAAAGAELARRRVVRAADFTAMGWPVPADATAVGPWLLAAGLVDELAARVPQVVTRYRQLRPLEPGPPAEVVRRALELPDVDLVPAVVRPPLALREGRVVAAEAALPPAVQRAVDGVRARLAEAPFAAPDANELAAAGLGPRELAAAVRDGQLLRIADGVHLAPGVEREARARLAALPQPFTLSQARQAWGTSRRVAVPLAEWLDARGVTERLPDTTRRLR
ncbi:selenocysteine-specific translation elongation factor [Modestobacter sp. I12A-02628]|uniref:Selenocysteine-specific elongation factor n=1 Tax=Goekera deserti TaxID=2497753 RepID=A0A7K3WBC0_9ACTN|nr:selenocysteine-specific translation elongation factor [Goekera deserti]MPQ97483.1 selenocysteine-specific translation elongation factor [Goekera deserti]NDI47916.1 selenocysteine-specific translation elongation factor [Goekera deserti]NEL53664.1 selenocysteine-specific translation elongation factor [Goekera deserti]